MPLIMNPIVRKLSLDVTTSSSTTANFVLKFASSHTIIECGVIFSYNNNATISNNQGKWVAATNFNGGIDLSNNITHSFVYAPYYAIPYLILSTGTYYGTAIQFTPNFPTVTINGKLWAAANLGATVIATNAGTNSDMYGFYYQWGRGSDGHQLSNSTTTPTLSSTSNPGNGNFITTTISPNDWISPQDNTLWQGVDGKNNPCPSGYRIPTIDEYKSASPTLLIPNSNFRSNNGVLQVTNWGYYWSSTAVNKTTYWIASALDRPNGTLEKQNANAFPIRCIQN